MRPNANRLDNNEASTWIAYTDFLTTVLILFVIIGFVALSRLRAITDDLSQAQLLGEVLDADSKRLLEGCFVYLGDKQARTDELGKFSFNNIELSHGAKLSLRVEAEQYLTYAELIELKLGRNFKPIKLTRPQARKKGDIKVETLPGDAFFEVGSAEIKKEALATLTELGKQFREALQPDDVIVVQGHTDDQPYKTNSKSNWGLSGERAAAVCRVFQEARFGVQIPGHQLLAMGYGSFQPLEKLEPSDNATVQENKRRRNRRIEIRKMKGAEVLSAKTS